MKTSIAIATYFTALWYLTVLAYWAQEYGQGMWDNGMVMQELFASVPRGMVALAIFAATGLATALLQARFVR